MANTDSKAFKTCPCCGQSWLRRQDFLNDPTLHLNGYMADFKTVENGLFYFTHLVAHCNSTMVIPAGEFLDLYTGKKQTKENRGQATCRYYCQDKNRLDRCDAICEYAFVREVIQKIITFQKGGAQTFEEGMVQMPWR